jgi:hypothetical protein
MFHDSTSRAFTQRRQHFAETLFRSKFVLCPRGHGTSSIRLFETLAAGRVPVVISDGWTPPSGPSWESIVVRWSEAAPIDRLLAHLEELEPRAEEMGSRAHTAFADWFAPAVLFDRIVTQIERLAAIGAAENISERGLRGQLYRRMMAAESAGRLRKAIRTRTRR